MAEHSTSEESGSRKKRYVVQVFSNFEKKAMLFLQERIKNAEPEAAKKFGEVVIPTERVVEIRDNKKYHSERKFYPGYILVEMELDDQTWSLVRQTPRIVGFIGGENPIPLTDKEWQAIKSRMELGSEKPVPKEIYEAGEEIRVIDGPFNDSTATVEEVDYEKSKLTVSVMIFGRPTPVTLAFGQVKKF